MSNCDQIVAIALAIYELQSNNNNTNGVLIRDVNSRLHFVEASTVERREGIINNKIDKSRCSFRTFFYCPTIPSTNKSPNQSTNKKMLLFDTVQNIAENRDNYFTYVESSRPKRFYLTRENIINLIIRIGDKLDTIAKNDTLYIILEKCHKNTSEAQSVPKLPTLLKKKDNDSYHGFKKIEYEEMIMRHPKAQGIFKRPNGRVTLYINTGNKQGYNDNFTQDYQKLVYKNSSKEADNKILANLKRGIDGDDIKVYWNDNKGKSGSCWSCGTFRLAKNQKYTCGEWTLKRIRSGK